MAKDLVNFIDCPVYLICQIVYIHVILISHRPTRTFCPDDLSSQNRLSARRADRFAVDSVVDGKNNLRPRPSVCVRGQLKKIFLPQTHTDIHRLLPGRHDRPKQAIPLRGIFLFTHVLNRFDELLIIVQSIRYDLTRRADRFPADSVVGRKVSFRLCSSVCVRGQLKKVFLPQTHTDPHRPLPGRHDRPKQAIPLRGIFLFTLVLNRFDELLIIVQSIRYDLTRRADRFPADSVVGRKVSFRLCSSVCVRG